MQIEINKDQGIIKLNATEKFQTLRTCKVTKQYLLLTPRFRRHIDYLPVEVQSTDSRVPLDPIRIANRDQLVTNESVLNIPVAHLGALEAAQLVWCKIKSCSIAVEVDLDPAKRVVPLVTGTTPALAAFLGGRLQAREDIDEAGTGDERAFAGIGGLTVGLKPEAEEAGIGKSAPVQVEGDEGGIVATVPVIAGHLAAVDAV